MPKPCDPHDNSELRQRLIGLGASSARKSYYPALQRSRAELLATEQELLNQLEENRLARVALQQALGEAQSANRAKSEFLANMSHELRTPLNGILGTLQLLETTEPSATQAHYLDLCQKSGWALLSLINDILDLSCIEAGQLAIAHEPLNPRELVETACQPFLQELRRKGLQLHVDLAPTLPAAVVGDKKRLLQILFNLIGNAVKFTAHGGVNVELLVTAESVEELRLQVVVRDSGIGIEADLLERIFEPFVQGELSYKKRFQGAGLGLAIVKRLVVAMQGTVHVASRLGEGTTFTVELPVGKCAGPSGVASAPPQPEHAPRKVGGRVLLVEDNDGNRQLIRLMLLKLGQQVDTATNGLEALHALARADYDLVLMDIQMPVMDGIEALQQIRAGGSGVRNPRIPVVAMTAYAMPQDREKFLAAGMDAYIKKPILLAKLDELLASMQLR